VYSNTIELLIVVLFRNIIIITKIINNLLFNLKKSVLKLLLKHKSDKPQNNETNYCLKWHVDTKIYFRKKKTIGYPQILLDT